MSRHSIKHNRLWDKQFESVAHRYRAAGYRSPVAKWRWRVTVTWPGHHDATGDDPPVGAVAVGSCGVRISPAWMGQGIFQASEPNLQEPPPLPRSLHFPPLVKTCGRPSCPTRIPLLPESLLSPSPPPPTLLRGARHRWRPITASTSNHQGWDGMFWECGAVGVLQRNTFWTAFKVCWLRSHLGP